MTVAHSVRTSYDPKHRVFSSPSPRRSPFGVALVEFAGGERHRGSGRTHLPRVRDRLRRSTYPFAPGLPTPPSPVAPGGVARRHRPRGVSPLSVLPGRPATMVALVGGGGDVPVLAFLSRGASLLRRYRNTMLVAVGSCCPTSVVRPAAHPGLTQEAAPVGGRPRFTELLPARRDSQSPLRRFPRRLPGRPSSRLTGAHRKLGTIASPSPASSSR